MHFLFILFIRFQNITQISLEMSRTIYMLHIWLPAVTFLPLKFYRKPSSSCTAVFLFPTPKVEQLVITAFTQLWINAKISSNKQILAAPEFLLFWHQQASSSPPPVITGFHFDQWTQPLVTTDICSCHFRVSQPYTMEWMDHSVSCQVGSG
jgi:hypothetical protein